MKRSNIVHVILGLGMLFFSSCTKHLKDDLRQLQQQYDDLSHGLGSDEPITATTTFKDEKGTTISITDTYKFKAGNYQSQSMTKLTDGTYNIDIVRFGDVDGGEGLGFSFNYNPTTKAVTRQWANHYWSDAGNYYSNALYDVSRYTKGLSFDINLGKLDVATGEISVNVKIEATEEYSKIVPAYYVPVVGSPVSTSFSFTGKLRIF